MKTIQILGCVCLFQAVVVSTQAQSNETQIGIKVGSILHNRVNDEFENSELRISEVNKYGVFYHQKTLLGLGVEIDLLFNDEADVNSNNNKIFTLESYQFNSFLSLDIPFNNASYVRLKAGYNRNYYEISNASNNPFNSSNTLNSDYGYILGGGFGLNISKHMGILTEYTHSFVGEKSNSLLAGVYFLL